MSVSRFKRGKDGKSPYERQKGRPCDTPVVPFGEVVMFRLPEVARDRHQALEERYEKGVWRGHSRVTSEGLAGTDHGVRNVWANHIRRLPADQQWDGERLKTMNGVPDTAEVGQRG